MNINVIARQLDNCGQYRYFIMINNGAPEWITEEKLKDLTKELEHVSNERKQELKSQVNQIFTDNSKELAWELYADFLASLSYFESFVVMESGFVPVAGLL